MVTTTVVFFVFLPIVRILVMVTMLAMVTVAMAVVMITMAVMMRLRLVVLMVTTQSVRSVEHDVPPWCMQW